MENITIHHLTIEELVQHARNKFPEETCGILLGKDGNITDILILENLATKINKINHYTCPYDNTEGFRFNEYRAWKAVEEAQQHGLDCLGIWHSHPHLSAELTEDDLEMILDRKGNPIFPDAYHLIAGVTESDYSICVWAWDSVAKKHIDIYNTLYE